MGYRGRARSRPEGGFSLIEMVIVVGLIVTLAAVALPGISRYIRNYKILGGVRNVASELRTARSQAVSKNVQNGVYLVIVGPTTYRFVREDIGPLVGPPTPGRLGPLLDLPQSIRFQPGNAIGMRFNNLGAACPSGGLNCAAVSPPLCEPAEIAAARCSDGPAPFIATAIGDPQITLLETDTTMIRRILIGSGGRVYTDLQ